MSGLLFGSTLSDEVEEIMVLSWLGLFVSLLAWLLACFGFYVNTLGFLLLVVDGTKTKPVLLLLFVSLASSSSGSNCRT